MVTASEREQPELPVVSSDPTELELRGRFVDAMAANSTSVHVVSTANREAVAGVTVSACNSVCADPPTLLVCRKSWRHHRTSATTCGAPG